MRHCLPILLLLFAAGTHAQSPALPPSSAIEASGTPTVLRTSARNVVLDVIVVDRLGRPVRNLREEDFIIREDKQAQTAHLLVEKSTAGTLRISEPSRVRNLILLDEANVRFLDLALARERLVKFFESDGARGRTFALMTMTPTRTALVQDFTTDTVRLAEATRKMPAALPNSPADNFVDQEKSFESLQQSIGVIETIAHALSGSPDHINLLWITSGFPTLSLIGSSGEMQFNYEEVMRHASNLYLNARMTIYTVDSSGVQIIDSLPDHRQPGTPSGQAGGFLRESGGGTNNGDQFVAQQNNMTSNQAVTNDLLGNMDARTGGRAYSNQNFIDVGLRQAVENGSAVYSFAYAPINRNYNGEFRAITVTMRTPGLFARAREGYYAVDTAKSASEDVRRAQLASALDSPLLYHGLNVTGRLLPAKNGYVLEVRVATADVEWAANNAESRVTQSIALAGYTAADKPVGSQRWRVTMARTDADRQREFVYRLAVRNLARAARYRLVVADDPGTHIGTAEVVLEVPPVS